MPVLNIPSPPHAPIVNDRHEARSLHRQAVRRAQTTQRALSRATSANEAALTAQALAALAAGIPAVPLAPPLLPQGPVIIDRAELVTSFSAGLYSVPSHLRGPLRLVAVDLLQQALSADETLAADGVGAFQLLPGLIEYSSRAKPGLSPAQVLAGLLSTGNTSAEVFRIALSWKSTIRARLPLDNARPINPETTRARIEALSKVGRLSPATRVCHALDHHLKGLPATPPPAYRGTQAPYR